MILLFFSLSLFFLILLLISRLRKIGNEKKTAFYKQLADNVVFSVLFADKSYSDFLSDAEYVQNIKNDFFRLLLLDSLITLHRNYSGTYSQKIELFYSESALIQETYKKLNSRKWPVKCEAIIELAEMNIVDSHQLIQKYVRAKNLTLRQEAIVALVKLRGLDGLSFLVNYNEMLSDWMQLNLLAVIKNNYPTTPEPFYNNFLFSSNKSVALFGKRLKAFYEQTNEPFMEQLEMKDPLGVPK
ncbi:MAG: HEAT repeat domain-containing protein [Bacteroidota bacterium]